MTTRKGNWLLTYSGRRFFPWAPRPEDIRLEDIAHALAQLPRYNGHLPEPYSVAQHSLMVARHCPPEFRLVGLLHDAAEAYVGDLTRPVKQGLLSFQLLEQRIWEAIAHRFELPTDIPAVVKEIDNRALATEFKQLVPAPHDQWGAQLPWEPLPEQIRPLPWREVKVGFIEYFELLWQERESLRELNGMEAEGWV